MPVNPRPSDRLRRLPPYLFAELERKQRELEAAGKDVINLGIGDPDRQPPKQLRDLVRGLLDTEGLHRYSSTAGDGAFRGGVARFMAEAHGVQLDPDREICLGVGAKEVIAHIPLALTNPGDVILLPDPGYPPYRSGTLFALCEPFVLPLREENGFLPDLDAIPPDVARRAKILYLNYPNNPTGAVATEAFYRRVIEFADRWGILVVSDESYAELYYDAPPVSFLALPGAKEVGIAVHSLTKTMSAAGWRIAWICGNPRAVEILRAFKANCDSGQFLVLQRAVGEFLPASAPAREKIRNVYRERRDLFVHGLRRLGWDVPCPEATFYIWFPTPGRISSTAAASAILEQAHVVLTPGTGFGEHGEGFLRAALTQEKDRIQQAIDRMARVSW